MVNLNKLADKKYMKTFRKQLCQKCLQVLRAYEAEKQRKHRRLRINEVVSQEKIKIKIKKQNNEK